MAEPVLEIKGLSYFVPVGLRDKLRSTLRHRVAHRPFRAAEAASYKPILRDVSLEVRPGELVAVIGASGCGKTSLLNLIANRVYTRTYEGEIKLLGKPVGPWAKAALGYVAQEDTLHPLDTPAEAVSFVAACRLPGVQHGGLVDSIIEGVQLGHVRDSRIGTAGGQGFDAGFVKEGLSGGERRRVSIGRELVTGAKLLLLDECTSGLDVHTANSVIELLHSLTRQPYDRFVNAASAAQNLAVLCTIHQPSSYMWRLFDRVVVMDAGRIVYSARTADFQAHMGRIGAELPSMCNPADFLIEYLKGPDGPAHANALRQLTNI